MFFDQKYYISAPFPKHLWSNESKFKKSWILFNSDEKNLDMENFEHKEMRSMGSFDSRDVDEYFKAYAANK